MSIRVGLFVAGMQKAGTTALDALLRADPRICMARKKEPHFFDDETVDWARPDYGAYHRMFRPTDETRLIGEATPVLTWWPPCLERVARYNPDARLVVMLRHPAHRAHSQWKMNVSLGNETLSFEAAVSQEGRVRAKATDIPSQRRFSYVERGFYAGQIARAEVRFPGAVKVVLTDDLWRRPADVLARLQGFVDLEPLAVPADPGYVVPVDSRGVEAADPAAITALTALYAEDIARTAALTGLDLSAWLDPAYREAALG